MVTAASSVITMGGCRSKRRQRFSVILHSRYKTDLPLAILFTAVIGD